MAKDEHRSTSRVLSILKLLALQQEGCTLAELSQILDAPKSSLFPIIHTMADQNFVSYHEEKQRYTIGLNSYLVGSTYLKNHNMYERVLDEMRHIVDQCSEICQFGILEGSEVLYIAKVDSPEPVRLASDIGKRLPAYCTSLGKSLLSRTSPEELNALYPDPLIPFTAHTVKDLDELSSQLEEIRKTSIAVEQGETHPDISCISTPLIKSGKVAASISVSVPTFRFTAEKKHHIEHLLLASKEKLDQLLEQNDLIF